MTAWALQHLLLSVLTAGSVVLAGVLLSRRTRDPVSRYRLIANLLPALLLLFPIQVLVAQLGAPTRFAGHAPENLVALMPEAPVTVEEGRRLSPGPPARSGGQPVNATPIRTTAPVLKAIAPIAVGAYLAGLCVLFCLLALRLMRTVAFLRTCRPVRDQRTLAVWSRLLAATGGTRWQRVRLLESERVHAPGCWGVLHAALVLPPSRGLFGADRLELALRHELVHLRRRDALVSLARELLCSLYWFNPFVWIYARMLVRRQELSCDAIVLYETGKHRTYAATLLDFCSAPTRLARSGAALTMVIGIGSPRELQRRLAMIDRIQSFPPPAARVSTVRFAAVLAAAFGSAAAVACSVSPGPMPRRANAQPATSPPAAEPEVALRLGLDGIDVEKIEAKAVKSIVIHAGGGRRDGQSILRLLTGHGEPIPHAFSSSDGLNEQETLVSAQTGAVRNNVLTARNLIVNLPEDSMLRAEITGERIDLEKSAERTRLTIHSGQARVIDEEGVARVILSASRPDHLGVGTRVEPAANGQGGLVRTVVTGEPGTVIHLDITAELGEVVMRASASRVELGQGEGGRATPSDVHAVLDMTTGVPAGEKEPPPGSVRYYLQGGEEKAGQPLRVKMQWVHDLSKVGKGAETQPHQPGK